MSITLTTVETKVRNLIGDLAQNSEDVRQYTTSNVWTLAESNVISVSGVTVNDDATGVTYTYDSSTNKVTITSDLSTGDIVKIQYTSYPSFSSTEIQGYIEGALTFISTYNYADWEVVDDSIYPDPDTRETNLIAMVTALIIDPDNKSYKLPDLAVTVPKDVPLHDKIAAVIATFKKDSHGVFDII